MNKEEMQYLKINNPKRFEEVRESQRHYNREQAKRIKDMKENDPKKYREYMDNVNKLNYLKIMKQKEMLIENCKEEISLGKIRFEHFEGSAEIQRLAQERFRKTERGREYQRTYQREYVKDPINNLAKQARDSLGALFRFKNTKAYGKSRREILEKKLGYTQDTFLEKYNSAFLKYHQKLTADHLIGLKCLIYFGITDFRILNDLENIQFIPQNLNSGKYQYVNEDSFRVGEILEKKYPIECAGLIEYMKNWNALCMVTRKAA